MPEMTTYPQKILALGAKRLARMTAMEIAERVGCNRQTVYMAMIALGLPYRRSKTGRKPGAPMRDMAVAMLAQGMTGKEVAEILSTSPSSVYSMAWRARHGVGA